MEVLVYNALEGFNEYILDAQGSEVVEKHDVKCSCLPLVLKLFLLQPLISADLSPYFLLGLRGAQIPRSGRGC